jgi:ribosome-binding factor A
MPSKRIARLNEQLKREISGLLRTEVRDPRVGLVSVTGVDIAADLGSARVFVRMMGDDAERADSMEGLVAAAPYVRKLLGQELHVRRVPELRFQEDRSMEQAQRIERILEEVLPHDGPSGSAAGEGSEAGPAEPADPVSDA